MVRQRVAVLVLQRLDRAAANVLRSAAPLRNYACLGVGGLPVVNVRNRRNSLRV